MTDIALAVALPLLGAFLLPLAARSGLRWLPWALGPAVLAATTLVVLVNWSNFAAPYAIALGGFAPPLGIAFYVDRLALVFALAVPLLSLLL